MVPVGLLRVTDPPSGNAGASAADCGDKTFPPLMAAGLQPWISVVWGAIGR
ncbi:hypothetical protein SBV1_1870004 [Verrucomicrobia bacterium]|nr:hypothetical protein SBV1_1870004 [Verrucomicrobiota bacterium]